MQNISSYIKEYLSVQKLKDDEYDKQYVLFEFTSDTIHSDKVLKEKLKNYKNRIITLWSPTISGVNTDYYILTIKELKDCFSNHVKVPLFKQIVYHCYLHKPNTFILYNFFSGFKISSSGMFFNDRGYKKGSPDRVA